MCVEQGGSTEALRRISLFNRLMDYIFIRPRVKARVLDVIMLTLAENVQLGPHLALSNACSEYGIFPSSINHF